MRFAENWCNFIVCVSALLIIAADLLYVFLGAETNEIV